MLHTYYFSQKQLEVIQETSFDTGMRETFVNGIQYTEKISQSSVAICSWEDSEVVFIDTVENIGEVTLGKVL
jgi:hypothetical protein